MDNKIYIGYIQKRRN